MSAENDLALAYHMGYDDALAKRKSDAGKAQVLAPYDLAAENAKLRELVRDMWFWGYEGHMDGKSQEWQMKHIDGVLDRMRELGIDADGGTMARLRFDRTAPRVIVADGDTDCATGHCECGGCGGAIDCWDAWCRWCGARMEDA